MKVTLKLSESLLSIYRESQNPLEEVIIIDIDEPTTLYSILLKVGINPLLAPLIVIGSKQISHLNYLIENEETITIIGPLAGG